MSLKDHANDEGYSAPTAFSYRYHHTTSFFQKLYSESRFMIHLKGKLRRLIYVNFRKKYVQNQLVLRKGACRQCGTCCNLLVTCPMLLKKGGCLAYGVCRPQTCKVFPIDQKDIQEVKLSNGFCGFYFDKENRW